MATWQQGTSGDDTLVARTGDTLQGGAGNDLYRIDQITATVVMAADGSRDVLDFGQVNGHFIVRLAPGLTADDLELVWTSDGAGTGSQMVLRLTQGRGELRWPRSTLTNRPGDSLQLLDIQLADGTLLGKGGMDALIARTVQQGRSVQGTANGEYLSANAWAANQIDAGAGNDTIESGADGRQADLLLGGQGDDTYLIGAGWGRDTLSDYDGVNEVRFGPDVPLSSLHFHGDHGTLVIASGRRTTEQGLVNARDELMIQGFADGLTTGKHPVTRFVFEADGGLTLTPAQLYQRLLASTDGKDIIAGLSLPDQIDGGAGDDWLAGLQGADTLSGGAGRDTLLGMYDDDVYIGGQGDDLMLDAEQGPLGVVAGYSSDTYRFNQGDGSDTIYDVSFSPFTNVPSHDVLQLGEGMAADDLDVYRVKRASPYGEGLLDSIVVQRRGSSDGVTLLAQTRAPDTGYYGVDEVLFADGSSWSAAELQGRAIDLTTAGAGLYKMGGDGADTLVADGDGQTMQGNAGADVYLVDTRPFQTTINEPASGMATAGERDEVRFVEGIRPEDVTVTWEGSQALVLRHRAGASVTIRQVSGWSGEQGHVRVAFADGTMWQPADLLRLAVQPSLPQDDQPDVDPPAATLKTGSFANDVMSGTLLQGGQGEDTLNGTGGRTVVIYNRGDGDDVVRPVVRNIERFGTRYYEGDVVVRLGEGIRPEDLRIQNRPVEPGTVDNIDQYQRRVLSFNGLVGSIDVISLAQIEFADGTVFDQDDFIRLSPDKVIDLRATFDAKVAVGGIGNDTVFGNEIGNDIRTGDGDDIVYAGNGDDYIDLGRGNDHVEDRQGSDTLIGGEGADTIVWDAYGTGHDGVWLDNQDTLRINVPASPADLGYKLLVEGSKQEAITLTLRSYAAEIDLHGLDQALDARVVFSDGQVMLGRDILTSAAAASSVSVSGGARDDVLYGRVGNDSLIGWAGNDALDGLAGDDFLHGGQGNDTLRGGVGADLLVFQAGDGQDVVHADAQDRLNFLQRSPSTLQVGKLGEAGANTIVLRFADNPADAITLQDVSQTSGPGAISFDGQQAYTWADIWRWATQGNDQTLSGGAGRDTLNGGGGNDTLSGLANNDVLSGGAGNDLIDGGAGSDTMRGGLGNDTLIGGKGNDVYQFARGDGRDTVSDNDSTWFNSDLLQLSGAATNQLWFTRSGNNLDIAILGTQDKVTVQDWFKGSSYRVEKITAMDSGKSLTAAKVNNLVTAMAGFSIDPATTTQLPANTPANITRLIASSWA